MEKIKILVVEDETLVAFDIESALESLGYDVLESASNYDEAISSVETHCPALIMMDINLANSKDGIETAHAIKQIKDIPIIYLTAFSDDITINRAIETNPIGYLLKPFRRDELKSMISLGLHKTKQKSSILDDTGYENLADKYYFDMKNQNLYYEDIPIKLSQNEKKLLSILLEARGNIVSFSDIEAYVWSDKIVAESTIRSLIFRLRAKLEYKVIETIQGFGCKIL